MRISMKTIYATLFALAFMDVVMMGVVALDMLYRGFYELALIPILVGIASLSAMMKVASLGSAYLKGTRKQKKAECKIIGILPYTDLHGRVMAVTPRSYKGRTFQ